MDFLFKRTVDDVGKSSIKDRETQIFHHSQHLWRKPIPHLKPSNRQKHLTIYRSKRFRMSNPPTTSYLGPHLHLILRTGCSIDDFMVDSGIQAIEADCRTRVIKNRCIKFSPPLEVSDTSMHAITKTLGEKFQWALMLIYIYTHGRHQYQRCRFTFTCSVGALPSKESSMAVDQIILKVQCEKLPAIEAHRKKESQKLFETSHC